MNKMLQVVEFFIFLGVDLMKKIGSLLLLSLASLVGHAQTSTQLEPSKWQFAFSLGFASSVAGGSDIAAIQFTNGQRQSINAGSGYSYMFGVSYALNDIVDIQANLGQENSSIKATNSEVNYRRNPLELMVFKNAGSNWRLGGGVRTLHNPFYGDNFTSATGAYSESGVNLSATGSGVLEAQYLTKRGGNTYGRFGASAKLILGERVSNANQTWNGDHVTLSLMYMY